MSNISLCHIFDNNKSSLKETSKSEPNPGEIYNMTESELEVIDFDGVKDDYIRGLKVVITPKSNDALFERDKEWFFIEFKSGKLNKKEIDKVKFKILDSLLIFTDIINKGISYTRENLNYILVYKKDYSTNNKNELDNSEVQESRSFDKLKSDINKEAKSDPDEFKLKKQFEKLYFKKVYTYTEEEFEEEFVKQYAQQ